MFSLLWYLEKSRRRVLVPSDVGSTMTACRIQHKSFVSCTRGFGLAKPRVRSSINVFPKKPRFRLNISHKLHRWSWPKDGLQSSTTRWYQRTTLTFRASPHENVHVKLCQVSSMSYRCLISPSAFENIWGSLRALPLPSISALRRYETIPFRAPQSQ